MKSAKIQTRIQERAPLSGLQTHKKTSCSIKFLHYMNNSRISFRGSIEKRGARSNTSGQHWVARWGPSGASMAEEPGKALLDPSRLAVSWCPLSHAQAHYPHCCFPLWFLQEILAHNTVSVMDHSMSVTEIHARNKVMQSCGVNQEEYHIVFTASAKVSPFPSSYPFQFHSWRVFRDPQKHSLKSAWF